MEDGGYMAAKREITIDQGIIKRDYPKLEQGQEKGQRLVDCRVTDKYSDVFPKKEEAQSSLVQPQ
jgi:hypothetical protein